MANKVCFLNASDREVFPNMAPFRLEREQAMISLQGMAYVKFIFV